MYMMWHTKFKSILKPESSGLPLLLDHILVFVSVETKRDIKGITEIRLSKICISVVEA